MNQFQVLIDGAEDPKQRQLIQTIQARVDEDFQAVSNDFQDRVAESVRELRYSEASGILTVSYNAQPDRSLPLFMGLS